MSGTDVYYMSVYFKASFIANDISVDLSNQIAGEDKNWNWNSCLNTSNSFRAYCF